MKKILAVFDGLKFSKSTRDYSIQVAKQNDAQLIGIFLDDMTYHSYKIYELVAEVGVSEKKLKELEEIDKKQRTVAAQQFEVKCREAGINFVVRHDPEIALKELLHESVYADLVVIDNSETFTHYNEKAPTRFVRELLSNVQSPVLLVPSRFREPKKIILLYDGEPSAVHAIKMFSYMMPAPIEMPVSLLSVRGADQEFHLPDNRLMREFVNCHFPQADYVLLKGDAEKEIKNYMKRQKENLLVVLGAYQRGAVSRWFRKSMADALIQEFKVPLFIAHSKQ